MSMPVTLKPSVLAQAQRVLVAGQQVYRFRKNPPIELALVDQKTMVLGTPGFLESMLRAATVPGNAAAKSSLRQLVGTRAPSDEVAVFNISTPWVDPKGSSFSYSPKVHAEMATATAAAASEAGAEGAAEAEAELIVTFMSNADGRTVADDTLLYVPQPLRLRVGGAAGLRLP